MFRLQGFQLASPGGERLQARDPAAWPSQAAIHFLGAGEEDLGADGGKRREVLRGETDAPLFRGKPDKGAIPSVEPGAGAGNLRPASLVQSAKDKHVRRKQARVERPLQKQPWMRVLPRGLLPRARDPAKKARIAAKIEA